ncbi:MAG: hypothetical protein K2M42_07335 [Oscillospiraceae bacterium]|nr:hypothetical protein [Oscillospiraceae bacterium]
MKKYREYMDNVRASDTLHQRLLGLETSGTRPVTWKKYGTMAAALVLVVGLGAWGLGKSGGWDALAANFRPAATTVPEIADEPVPDIALVAPGDVTEPGEKTIGGYEVVSGSGENAMVSYYVLPYIEYGPPSDISAAASLVPPAGGIREATRDDVLALVGKEDALTAHLDWGGRELRGTVGFEADGTVWMLSLWGEGQDTAFSLELSPGRLPPTCCVVIGEQRTITNVWGVEVSGVNCRGAAYGDTERGVYMDVCREVEFIANGVGCRMKAYGTQDGAVEELVSRFVRWAVLEGLELSGIGPDNGICGYPLAPSGETGDSVPDMSEPPILRVLCAEGLVDGRSGNYHWNYPGEDGQTVGAIACGLHPLDFREAPSLTTADDAVTLDFGRRPDRVSAVCWPDSQWGNTSAASQAAEVGHVMGHVRDGYALRLEEGGWIYEISAEWDDYGTASYVFYLIKN